MPLTTSSTVPPPRRRRPLDSRTKKDVVTEFRTGEILQAARRVFAERGFQEATVADIASEAGLAKGTVYLYYPSKQDVYAAALRGSAAELASRTAESIERAPAADGKVRAFVDATIRYFDEHPEFFRIYHCELGRAVNRQASRARDFDEIHLGQVRALERVLQSGARKRAVRPLRTEVAALAIFDTVLSVIAQRFRGRSRGSLEEDIAFAFELAWKGIEQR
jgi:AcrR family transcriptional regulator